MWKCYKEYSKPGAIIIEGHVQGLSNVRSLGEAGIPVFVIDHMIASPTTQGIARNSFGVPGIYRIILSVF